MNKGRRIDDWAKEKFPRLTNRQIDEAIDAGLIARPNGKKIAKGTRLEEITLDTSGLEAHLLNLEKGNALLEISVIDERDDFWVVDKPAGVDSHPIGLFDNNTVTHWAVARLPEIVGEFPECQPTITPHRLDRGTSGLLIVAKTKHAYEEWRQRFHRKQVTKKYRASCWGTPGRGFYLNQNPIAHHPSKKGRMVTVKDRYLPPVLEAATEFRVLEVLQNPDYFTCDVTCHSGVTHQVRVHAADLGFPLLGDPLYDREFETRPLKPKFHELRAVSLSLEAVDTSLGWTIH